MKDPLDDALGLPPMERASLEVIVPEPVSDDPDYENVRQNLYRLMAKGEEQLDEIGDIARISQHPGAFEAFSKLLKTLVDTNKEMMEIKRTQRESSPGSEGPKTINNTLVATSDEILRMIKEKVK